jgi:polar amino acid transport system permease protein/octopine/nopaline transport system permease protein
MKLDFAYMAMTVLPALILAVPTSLLLLGTSGVIGNLLAVPVAVARLSRNPFLWMPAYLFILLMRGTPLLVQMYLVYYGLGQVLSPATMRAFPFLRDGIWYAIFALSINTAGYTGEILRGAILAVPHGEIEAARAFGMSRFLVFRRITLPRAIRICLPTMSSEMIVLLKATSLASTVTVYEVLGTAQAIRVDTFRVYDTLLGAAIVYIGMVFLLTRLLNWIERALGKDRRPLPGTEARPAKA